MSDNFDLFGDPIPTNHGGRGRPAHIPTIENRNRVKLLLALGWANARIAAALNCSEPTFRKHYFSEIKIRTEQRDRLEAAYAMQIWNQVREGNVGAMRLWAAFQQRNDAMVGHSDFYAEQRRAREDEKPDEPTLGKKEIAARDALTAGEGSGWGNDLKPH